MIYSKKYFAERVLKGLQDAFPNADLRAINEREIFLVLDDVVNSMARDNYFENWKLYGGAVDESFITTWDGDNAIAVVDPANKPSYIVLPATPAALPRHAGIDEIWPENYEYGAVRVMDHKEVRLTRRLMSGNMQGDLGGYQKGDRFEFNQVNVGKNFAPTFGVRLVVRDSTAMSLTETYPIPSNLREEVIKRAVDLFRERRMLPTDVVRDKQDAINRN
jgi:hypothetical protein